MSEIVAYSGGIDSTALALLMPEAEIAFTDTQWEHDDLYAAIDRFEAITGRNVRRIQHPDHEGGLPGYIREQKFMPNFNARYCTRIFKIEAMNLWLKERLPATLCIALRADEPELERIGNLTSMEGLTIRYPLRERGLVRADCVRICMEHGLLPRFPVYMARGGCKGCFFKRRSEVLAMRELDADTYAELQELEEGIQDERQNGFHMFANVGLSLRDFARQPMLFDQSEVWADAGTESCGPFCHR